MKPNGSPKLKQEKVCHGLLKIERAPLHIRSIIIIIIVIIIIISIIIIIIIISSSSSSTTTLLSSLDSFKERLILGLGNEVITTAFL